MTSIAESTSLSRSILPVRGEQHFIVREFVDHEFTIWRASSRFDQVSFQVSFSSKPPEAASDPQERSPRLVDTRPQGAFETNRNILLTA
jgi:hypothetical protein